MIEYDKQFNCQEHLSALGGPLPLLLIVQYYSYSKLLCHNYTGGRDQTPASRPRYLVSSQEKT